MENPESTPEKRIITVVHTDTGSKTVPVSSVKSVEQEIFIQGINGQPDWVLTATQEKP